MAYEKNVNLYALFIIVSIFKAEMSNAVGM